MKSRENRDIRTKGGKKVNVGMTENGKLRKIHFISIFSFIMRMSKQAKFSVCERMFVCQHKMARDCEPVSYLVTCFMEDMERASFHSFSFLASS